MKRQEQDQRIFEKLTRLLDKKEALPTFPSQLVLWIGQFFVGTPYKVGTLETKGAEHLVVNLRELDCITFVETVVALAWHARFREKSFEEFQRLLRKIRYRQGRLQGYSSRLHYVSDWIHDNQKKGFVRDVTAEIGGRPFRKTINFMTTNPDLYPPLRNAANLRRMKSIERTISKRSHFFIPKKALKRSEDRIRDGDLIGITTSTEGLDVQHVGIAARLKNRIHLLHASSKEGKVAVSKDTLYRYLMKNRARSGIMVVRINPSLICSPLETVL
ncbi:MAG TPA: N-acetylmuramoyl-L-alanine amidase-like domain-containing protein [Thermodesulfobacteriota bacterium]|nr:N-acetylmuramoyl-L-alanine amidase-like domain-containing protein [Thermodesulfobacteriota bacterium]